MRLLTSILLLCLLSACATQRKPVVAGEIPQQGDLNPQEVQYGSQVFNQLAAQYPIEEDYNLNARVRKIVTRLSNAATGSSYGNPWHVYVFKDDNFKNAAATRGNYIFVWTGILNSTNSDHQLATILAHELSHVLANHTTPTAGETANQIIAGSTGQVASSVLAASGQYYGIANIAGQLTSALMQGLIVNPGSQRLESEADTIGLFLMAKAGYNPQAAVDFWNKVREDPSFGGASISFLSTHPTSEARIANLEKNLPAARLLYQKNRK